MGRIDEPDGGFWSNADSKPPILSKISLLTVSLVFITLWLHTAYLTRASQGDLSRQNIVRRNGLGVFNIHRRLRLSLPSMLLSRSTPTTAPSIPVPLAVDGAPTTWPELFIFRRTKKTGSSSMMNALMDELGPLGYVALPHMPAELESVIRNEYAGPKPRRLMVLHHNKVTKNMHPRGRRAVVIADTLRDGFKHVTGYCRYMKGVKTCGDDMVRCLRANNTLSQIRYRWAGLDKEDSNTYIDLPLSSEHPALSTTVIRTVFANVTLRIKKYNVRKSSCPFNTPAKQVYDELYKQLDDQVEKLRKRMLIIAGYPHIAEAKIRGNITTEDMMRAADKIENEKYGFDDIKMAPPGKSRQVKTSSVCSKLGNAMTTEIS